MIIDWAASVNITDVIQICLHPLVVEIPIKPQPEISLKDHLLIIDLSVSVVSLLVSEHPLLVSDSVNHSHRSEFGNLYYVGSITAYYSGLSKPC